MLGLGLGLNLTKSKSGGGAAAFDKFSYDDNTLFFSANNADNTVNATGYNSMAIMPDEIHGTQKLVQPVKGLQPYVVDVGGEDAIDFNEQTAQHMNFDDFSEIAKGHGYYLGLNLNPTTNGNSTLLTVARNASSTQSRGFLYYTGSRFIGIKGDSNDGGSLGWLGYSVDRLINGTEYTVECNIIADGSTTSPVDIWFDGSEQAPLNAEDTNALTFPDTSPSNVIFGNQHSMIESLDGTVKEIVFQNANLAVDHDIRTTASTYLNAQR